MAERFRKVKAKLSRKGRRDSAFSAVDSRNASCISETSSQASFLGLPGEIRNQIYEYVAANTALYLPRTKTKKPPPPVGLLVACRQTYLEYKPLLLEGASIAISIGDYNFSNLVRVFERMSAKDLASLRANEQVGIQLYISHVPSRDDRLGLRAWVDYRHESTSGPYFGSGQRITPDLRFYYEVKFSNQMRPPRPISRYANGFQMKLDLLRTHVRLAVRLQVTDATDPPKIELKRIREDLQECAKIYEELNTERDGRDQGTQTATQADEPTEGAGEVESGAA